MIVLGMVVAVVCTMQLGFLPDKKHEISGMLLWLAIFLAGVLAIDRSCAAEQHDGCWEGLLAYPVAPALIYWAKFLLNVCALCVLECLLIPAFVALSGVNVLRPVWAIVAVALAANVGLSAVGTLLSVLANGMRQAGQLLMLVLLPFVIPVVLAAAEATRLIALERINDEWWRWLQLLAAFGVIFLTAGTVLFEFVIEE